MSSIERSHLIANAPWLAGSALTVLLDFVVCNSPLSSLYPHNIFFVCLIGPRPVLLLSIRRSPGTRNVAKTHHLLTSRSSLILPALLRFQISSILQFMCGLTCLSSVGITGMNPCIYSSDLNHSGTHKVQQHCEPMRGWYRGWSQTVHPCETTRLLGLIFPPNKPAR